MRKSRSRRLALWVIYAALPIALAAWVHSHWWLAHVEYKFGTALAPGTPRGNPEEWAFLARRVFINSHRGRWDVGISKYTSFAPDREGVSNWMSYGGWEAFHLPRSSVQPDDQALLYWSSISEFSVLGLGTRSTMRQGEESRLIQIPYWLPVCTLSASGLALWLPVHRQNRRRKLGLCPRCGYNLAHSPAGTPCPECGGIQNGPECDRW